MSKIEESVYKLIRSYYLAQFCPYHEYDRTVAEFACSDEILKATGKQITVMGWRSLFRDSAQDEEVNGSQILPGLSEGMQCAVSEVELKALKTLPPKPYTEGELIKAMKGIARYVSDPRLKQILKETTGIGTEATRAGINKGLLQRDYLVKKGKAVCATDAAFTLIDAVPAAITDPGMTAVWEQALSGIEKGDMTMEVFLAKQAAWISQLVGQYSKAQLDIKPAQSPACPLCGAGMRKKMSKNGTFWSCSKYPDCKGTLNIDNKKYGQRKIGKKRASK
jgi:Topoisomerase IA